MGSDHQCTTLSACHWIGWVDRRGIGVRSRFRTRALPETGNGERNRALTPCPRHREATPPRHREAVRLWRSMTSCLHGLPRFARNDSLSPSQGPLTSSSRGRPLTSSRDLSLSSGDRSLTSSRSLSLSSSRGRRPWRSMTSCLHGLPRFARNDGEGSSRWPGHASV